MMCTLYALQYDKGICQAKAKSNSEKIKPVALTIIELHLSEDKSVSQKSLNKNFMAEAFSIVLKTLLLGCFLVNTF